MNLTNPVLKGVIRLAELPGDSVTSLVQKVGSSAGLFTDDDGGLGMVMSALAPVQRRATAPTVSGSNQSPLRNRAEPLSPTLIR